jgi:hypothetical protein
MYNEREILIEQILARKEEADTGSPGRDPNCPDITVLMDTLLERASPEETRHVEVHAAGCADCAMRLEAFRVFLNDEDVPELPYEGSMLERMAANREFVPKRLPAPVNRREDLTEAVPVGYTALAQRAEDWPVLAAGLRSLWLPYLLGCVGLDTSHTDAMLEYLQQRIPIGPDLRLSALLPGWLVEFAQGVKPSGGDISPPSIDRPLVERIALRGVLDSAGENETDHQRRFREAAGARGLASVDELRRFAPIGQELPRDVLEYRAYLSERGREVAGEGMRLLQVG